MENNHERVCTFLLLILKGNFDFSFINKYIVAYKNYKEIWIKIKKLRMQETSSPLGSVKPKLVVKVRNFIDSVTEMHIHNHFLCFCAVVDASKKLDVRGFLVCMAVASINRVCLPFFELVGSQRRTKKVVHHQEVNEDKKLK